MVKIVARARRREAPQVCSFCEKGEDPSYKGYELLKSFLTPRGKILNKLRSGVCAGHQRRLSREVKRARELALL